jgi:hypothetical protein
MVRFKKVGNLEDSLLQSSISSINLKSAGEQGLILSQAIKALKQGKIRLLFSQLKSLFKTCLK